MRFQVRHLTTYRYSEAVQLSHHAAHLRPREVDGQSVGEVAIAIRPEPAVLHDGGRDYFGNPTTFFTIQAPHSTLEIEAGFEVETSRQPPLPPLAVPAWDSVRLDTWPGGRGLDELVMDFVFASPQVPMLAEAADFAAPSFTPGRPLTEAVLDSVARIHHDFAFDPEATTVGTPLLSVFHDRRGVCQDFAHVGIACLRSMGLAARYVSDDYSLPAGLGPPKWAWTSACSAVASPAWAC